MADLDRAAYTTKVDQAPIAGEAGLPIIPLSRRCRDCYEFGHEACGCTDGACWVCGDKLVVFVNRLGGHCAEHYAEGIEDQRLHEAGL